MKRGRLALIAQWTLIAASLWLNYIGEHRTALVAAVWAVVIIAMRDLDREP